MLKRGKVVGGMLILALGMVSLCERAVTAASADRVRTVRGEVVATNVTDSPHTIGVNPSVETRWDQNACGVRLP